MAQKLIEKVIVGAALTMAASVLLPIAKNSLPGIIQSGRRGLGELGSRTRSMIQVAREEMEDIVAEAQFERMKRQFDQEIFEGDRTQP